MLQEEQKKKIGKAFASGKDAFDLLSAGFGKSDLS